MTRQQKWQGKMRDEGRCIRCGALAVTKQFCEVHRQLINMQSLNRYHQKKATTKTVHTRKSRKAKKPPAQYRHWLERAALWQQYVEPLRQKGQFKRAEEFQKRADEYKRRAAAANTEAV